MLKDSHQGKHLMFYNYALEHSQQTGRAIASGLEWEIQSSFSILNYILDVWKCLSCHAGVVGYSQLAGDAVSHSMLPKAAPLLSSPPPGRKSDPKCNSAKIEEHYYSGTLFVF